MDTYEDILEEINNRWQVSFAAYCYEVEANPIMTDAGYDKLALSVRPDFVTGQKKVDKFFKSSFDPYTSMWIYDHPDLVSFGLSYMDHSDQYLKKGCKQTAC